MKYYKFLRVLAILLTLLLLILTWPAATALAKETLKLSPSKGVIGDKVTVTGSGYSSGEKVYIYFSSEEADVDDDIDDLDVWEKVITTYAALSLENGGEIIRSFKVPDELTDGDVTEKVSAGYYFVYATEREEGRILAKEEFTVTGIKVDPQKGPTGTEVEIAGVGFKEEEDIDVFFSVDEIEISSGDDETDDDGEFKLTIMIPESTAGDHVIIIEIDKEQAKGEFTVEPIAAINVTSGKIGDRVGIDGTGFAASANVTVTFGGDEVATSHTDNYGNLGISFNVPSVEAGTYVVEVKDGDGNSSKSEFTLASNIGISPATNEVSPGHVGMDMTVYGTDLKPNAMITITHTGTATVFSTTSKNDGSFSYTLKISESKPGKNIISVTDGVNQLQVAFFIELVVPATPQLLLPPTNTKPQRPITFDWKDTTDPSGVTYILQIASDEGFDDILIENQGLVESKYTISQTEDEILKSTKKGADYWWRVKAVDGAGNESEWTSVRSFDIGFLSGMADWLKYLLMGLGALLLLSIVFFIGRRIGHAH